MKLTLPFPPTTNHLYSNIPGRGRVVSAKYKAWKDAADGALWTQSRKPIVGPVSITITLQDKGRFDVDNRTKAAIDFLVRHGIIPDDDRTVVRRVVAQVGDVQGCEIEIEPA